ncbi:MAG: T9SS type A sorting domain-containing protein [Saprospiraceae bacterium]|nr:T9SS type A sorting domain-containing protein [Saprospiraceae bacterium]
MLKQYYSLLIIWFFIVVPLQAQIKNVFVETYYIADSDDLTNTTGGQLPEGSKTYRIFVEMESGSKMVKMYGDQNHPLVFSSSLPFYNNSEGGVSLAYELSKARLKDNTVALDSWLTLGQVTKTGSGTLAGVPKDLDPNGSVIGGSNNDGGSAEIASGLLKNNETAMGIPLTTSDGYVNLASPPTLWLNQGFYDVVTSQETSVFGTSKTGNVFRSNEAFISNSGTSGPLDNSNIVLVGQITTAGTLTFELNFQILTKEGELKKYVANDSILLNDEILLPLLKYPFVCGCSDPGFLEYSSNFACSDNSKCLTPIVFGCLDSLACNFNRNANFHISTLCCYIGYCNDIDLEIICPDLPPRSQHDGLKADLFPNPVSEVLYIDHNFHPAQKTNILIFDMVGNIVLEKTLTSVDREELVVSELRSGYYTLKIFNKQGSVTEKFVKTY